MLQLFFMKIENDRFWHSKGFQRPEALLRCRIGGHLPFMHYAIFGNARRGIRANRDWEIESRKREKQQRNTAEPIEMVMEHHRHERAT